MKAHPTNGFTNNRYFKITARAATLGLVASLWGCDTLSSQSAEPLDPGANGLVTFELTLPDGTEITTVSYVVTNAQGDDVLSDAIDVSDPNDTITVTFGLAEGNDYTITMTAETSAGIDCSGSASFDVVAGETSEVVLDLICDDGGGTGENNLGTVIVNATVVPGSGSSCPLVASYTVSATEAMVGEAIALTGSATSTADSSWSASSGAVADANSATTTFTCSEAGSATLTFTVSSGDSCSDSISVDLSCTANICQDLGHFCHPVDPGTGPIHDCHVLGHAGDDAACVAQAEFCRDTCGAALCTHLGSLCHNVDPGTGPIHDCHVAGHAGDASVCLEIADDCIALCTEAATAPALVTINFAGKVGESDFDCAQTYADQGSTGVTIEPQDFRFFVQELRLLTAAGEEVPVVMDTRSPWQTPEVALIDFENGQGACFSGNADLNSQITGMAPPGDYTGIIFVNGVPEALNHDDPTTLPAPLQAGGMTWGWLLGHKFFVAQVGQVPEPGILLPGAGLVHAGSTGCSGNPTLGTVTCALPNRNEIHLDGFDPAVNTIVVDIGEIFSQTDLTQQALCHSAGTFCTPMFESLGLNFTDGSALTTQTAFRVE